MKNYYDILKVDPESGQEIIEASYDELYKFYDPENFTVHQERLQAKNMRSELKEAYTVLSNPKKRERYDKFYKSRMVKQKRSSVKAVLIFLTIAVLIVITGIFIADKFFPVFIKLTNIISESPVFQVILILILVGISIHYFWTAIKNKSG